MKHKHCDLIVAWANGAEIQVLNLNNEWVTLKDRNPSWDVDYEYRIKPVLKPDVVLYGTFLTDEYGEGDISLTISRFNTDSFKFVFDGETLKPKSVEILENCS